MADRARPLLNLHPDEVADLVSELARHHDYDLDSLIGHYDGARAEALARYNLERRQKKVGDLIDLIRKDGVAALDRKQLRFLRGILEAVAAWEYRGDGYPEGARIAYEQLVKAGVKAA